MKKELTKGLSVYANKLILYGFCFLITFFYLLSANAQVQPDSVVKAKQYKNIIRYNLSGALLFGADRYIIFGYERVIRRNQSISVNFGKASLPKVVSITTDSFQLGKNSTANGTNFSIDYRFYLAKENKYLAPHGLYIGPYYSYNHFTRENQWNSVNSSSNNFVTTNTKFNIHTIGFELGYQLILWKRLALDFLMVGPGLGIYDYEAKFDGNLSAEAQKQLVEGLDQLLKQKFPGMNYVFADKKIDGNGTINTTTIGYRYLIHIGYNF